MRFVTFRSFVNAQHVGLFGCPTACLDLAALRRIQQFCFAPFPTHFRERFILPYAFCLFRVLPSRACPASPDVELLPWGCHPSSRHELSASLPPGSIPAAFPSSTFLTSSTAYSALGLVGLFHPTATSRVRSSGASPLAQPKCLVDTPCPLVVGVDLLLAV